MKGYDIIPYNFRYSNKITQIWIMQGAMPIKENWIFKGELYRKDIGNNFF
jgi:hypothetical protein